MSTSLHLSGYWQCNNIYILEGDSSLHMNLTPRDFKHVSKLGDERGESEDGRHQRFPILRLSPRNGVADWSERVR